MNDRDYMLAQATRWQLAARRYAQLGQEYGDRLQYALRHDRFQVRYQRKEAVQYQRKSATAYRLAADYMAQVALIDMVALVTPYADALVCYASTLSEHEGNRVAKALRDAILPTCSNAGATTPRPSPAC